MAHTAWLTRFPLLGTWCAYVAGTKMPLLSPTTGVPITSRKLTPNLPIRHAVFEYLSSLVG